MLNTWLAPLEGLVADRYGPRFVVMLGGLAAGTSWVLNSRAHSLQTLYVAAAIGGVGIGCVFGTCMGTALKWFPERRGFASGMIAAGYGLGAAITVIPISRMILESGYRHTFFFFGLLQGVSIFCLGAFLAKPAVHVFRPLQIGQIRQGHEFTPSQTVRTKVFWLIYLVYLMIGSGGMIVTAQLGPIARDFGVDKHMVTLLGFSMPMLAMAISIDNLANGITRPFSGFLSDKIGRENTMLLMFCADGLAFLGMAAFGRQPLAFLVFAALIFLFWGEIFSHLPGDLRRHFRRRACHRQQRSPLYRQGHIGSGGSPGQSHGRGNRNLDGGVAGDGGFQPGSGGSGQTGGGTDAAQAAGAGVFGGEGDGTNCSRSHLAICPCWTPTRSAASWRAKL